MDDEKGLKEGVYDPTRGRYLLRVKYQELQRPSSAHEDASSMEDNEITKRRNENRESGEGGEGDISSVAHLVITSHADHHQSLHPRYSLVSCDVAMATI